MDAGNEQQQQAPEQHDNEQQQAAIMLPPSQKRVRVSKPDLTIICKGGGGAERTFECHSIVMATHSEYFDALLSSTMKESTEKKVILEDVSPEVFEEAMRLLEDPVAGGAISPEQALKTASFYNRFEFANGLKLVCQTLGKLLDKWTAEKSKVPFRFETKLLMRAIVFAEESATPTLIEKSKAFLSAKFGRLDSNGIGIFELEDIQQIQRFLSNDGRQCLESFYDTQSSFEFTTTTTEEIMQPNFRETLLAEFHELLGRDLARRMELNKIKVTFRGIPNNLNNPHLEESSAILFLYEQFTLHCWHYEVDETADDYSGPYAGIGRVSQPDIDFQSTALEQQFLGEKFDMFDWFLVFEHGDKRYTFLSPLSKSQPLPPLGTNWVLVEKANKDSEDWLQKPSVKVEYVFGP
jgi:hypothetical protein